MRKIETSIWINNLNCQPNLIEFSRDYSYSQFLHNNFHGQVSRHLEFSGIFIELNKTFAYIHCMS